MEQNRGTESITRYAKHRRGLAARLDEIKISLDRLHHDIVARLDLVAVTQPEQRNRADQQDPRHGR